MRKVSDKIEYFIERSSTVNKVNFTGSACHSLLSNSRTDCGEPFEVLWVHIIEMTFSPANLALKCSQCQVGN